MNSSQIVFDVIGYFGVALVLFAYWVTTSKVQDKFDKNWLHIANAVGAIGIGVNAYYHSAAPGVTINSIWLLIALSALIPEHKKAACINFIRNIF